MTYISSEQYENKAYVSFTRFLVSEHKLGLLYILVSVPIHCGKAAMGFSVQLSSATQSCPTLCDPMNRMSGLPVHHQLPELTQIHVHRVSDAIQPSHPLWSPSLPASNPSQHQGLFK